MATKGDFPDIRTSPFVGSSKPKIKLIKVVFPLPDGPTMATVEPDGIFNSISLKKVSASLNPKESFLIWTDGSNPE